MDGNRLSPVEVGVSTSVGTAVPDQISYVTVSKMVKEETFRLAQHLEVKSMIVAEVTSSDELMSSIVKFVAKSVKQESGHVAYVKKKEPEIEAAPASPPSSDTSN